MEVTNGRLAPEHVVEGLKVLAYGPGKPKGLGIGASNGNSSQRHLYERRGNCEKKNFLSQRMGKVELAGLGFNVPGCEGAEARDRMTRYRRGKDVKPAARCGWRLVNPTRLRGRPPIFNAYPPLSIAGNPH